MKYPVARHYRLQLQQNAERAGLKNPRVWWDTVGRHVVSGTDSKGRRVQLSTKTLRDLFGVIHDAFMRGGF